MHAVFREQVDAELFTSFREAHQTVQSDHVGENSAAFIEVGHAEELKRCFFGAGFEGAVFRAGVIVVDSAMLFVENGVEDSTA